MRKFIFSLKFEAKHEIEAETPEEAEAKAREMMDGVRVVRSGMQQIMDRRGSCIGVCPTQGDAEDYVKMDPCCLEEVEG